MAGLAFLTLPPFCLTAGPPGGTGGAGGLTTFDETPVMPGSVLPMPPPCCSGAPPGPAVTVISEPFWTTVNPFAVSSAAAAVAMPVESVPAGTLTGKLP